MSTYSQRLRITSIDQFCRKIQIPEGQLYYILRKIEGLYRPSKQKKKSGGYREISVPEHALKSIQRKILKRILETVPLDSSTHAYRKKHSPITNARPHVGRRFLVNLDIEDFFPSVNYRMVQRLFTQLGCCGDVSKVLTRLVTYKGCLPQGAPTSPYIANLILDPVDRTLRKTCERRELVYTRYSDDITISGNVDFFHLVPEFVKIIENRGFPISREKTKFRRPRHRKSITGYTANEKLNVPKEQIRTLRTLIYKCIKYGPASQNRENKPNFREHLYGCANHVRSVNQHAGDKLLQMLGQVKWSS